MHRPKVICRQIETADLPAVADLLAEGFPDRPRAYWTIGLQRMAERPAIADYPRFGFLIETYGAIVGCILLIVAEMGAGTTRVRRGNVSSWYVKPEVRFAASMLVSFAFRLKDITFVNISPAPHTVPILAAQGYRLYAAGQVIAAPALSLRGSRVRVTEIRSGSACPPDMSPDEVALLRRHAGYGCLSLVCEDGGHSEPFVFARTCAVGRLLPAAQLIWCRDLGALSRFAGPLGRYLLRRGLPLMRVDANGAMAGLPGFYREGRAPKFFRGPQRPRLGDLADTELAIFGA